MRDFRQQIQRFGVSVEFLLDILREGVVMKERACCEILQCVSMHAKCFRGAYAHICHALRMAAGNMNEFRFHAVKRIGTCAKQT